MTHPSEAAEGPGLFAILLRQHRLAAGFSQEELAERAALSRRGICDLERGARRSPHPSTLRRLTAALGLTRPDQAALLFAARTLGRWASPAEVRASQTLAPMIPYIVAAQVSAWVS
jgi:transcriptional regulator with XRE-family HTH domain